MIRTGGARSSRGGMVGVTREEMVVTTVTGTLKGGGRIITIEENTTAKNETRGTRRHQRKKERIKPASAKTSMTIAR